MPYAASFFQHESRHESAAKHFHRRSCPEKAGRGFHRACSRQRRRGRFGRAARDYAPGRLLDRGHRAESQSGYRGPLYTDLTAAGWNFQFVGTRHTNPGYLPTTPIDQTGHNGTGGVRTSFILSNIGSYLAADPSTNDVLLGSARTTCLGAFPWRRRWPTSARSSTRFSPCGPPRTSTWRRSFRTPLSTRRSTYTMPRWSQWSP